MARPTPLPDNRFLERSSDFDLMAETSPDVLERWASLYLPAQDEPVRDELRRAIDMRCMRAAA